MRVELVDMGEMRSVTENNRNVIRNGRITLGCHLWILFEFAREITIARPSKQSQKFKNKHTNEKCRKG